MIEAEIESRFAGLVADLEMDGVKVFGSLSESDAEDVERNTDQATLELTTENRAQNMWEIPQYDISVRLVLESRAEFSGAKAAHLARVEKIVAMLDAYCGRRGASNLVRDFAIDGKFVPVYFTLGGGTNGYDFDSNTYTWEQTATIRGVVNHTNSNGTGD